MPPRDAASQAHRAGIARVRIGTGGISYQEMVGDSDSQTYRRDRNRDPAHGNRRSLSVPDLAQGPEHCYQRKHGKRERFDGIPEPVSVDGEWEQGLSASGTSGVQFAEVEVDIETGVTKVTRMLCVQDCGLIVDPLTAESQCLGGIVMGINWALYEDRILDRNTGQMVNPNMEWYRLAGMSDIPPIDVVLVDQAERGVIGIGEPPTVSTAAAIGNAVNNAIGVRVRSLPLTPYRILDAIAAQERAGGTL